jgi:hypothetical protein
MKDVPSMEELEEAENYALSKLCTEIPNTIGPGLTRWNSTKKVCEITKQGCDPFKRGNLMSVSKYDPNTGEEYTPRVQNQRQRDFLKYWNPDFYVMKKIKNSRKEVCARGNFLLFQWCEFPKTRGGGAFQKGITNVPKFNYNVRAGKETCDIPKSYCDSKGVSYSDSKRDCYVKGSQKVGEFFASPAMVRMGKVSDVRLKYDIVPMKHDWFGEGVHLYTFKWRPQATQLYGLSGEDGGCLADELPESHINIDENGFKNLNFDLNTPLMIKIRNFTYMKNGFEKILLNDNKDT